MDPLMPSWMRHVGEIGLVGVSARYEAGGRLVIDVAESPCKMTCCGRPCRKNGILRREVNDLPLDGRPVLIRYRTQRWLCVVCGRNLKEDRTRFVNAWSRRTRRLDDAIDRMIADGVARDKIASILKIKVDAICWIEKRMAIAS